MILDKLEPFKVFEFFEEISSIPRGSSNEKNISDYLVKFAEDRGLWVFQDKHFNIIIKKEASIEFTNSPTVILQGHMDMVCEKNRNTVHDFLNDPIKLYVDGDFVKAEGTTLGADNGIAIAMSLALLDDKEAKHPALEVVITTEEETGMYGAENLDASMLAGKYLINIDSEDEGEFLTSCAGGARVDTIFTIEKSDVRTNDIEYSLMISGLKGGHSGMEIDKQRGNSIKILGRILFDIDNNFDIFLSDINGGSKDNAIPREAEAIIHLKIEDEEMLSKYIDDLKVVIKNELSGIDDNLSIVFNKLETNKNSVFTKDFSSKVISTLFSMPNGVLAMSKSLKGLVESSNNLGVLTTSENEVKISCAIRSSVNSKKSMIINQITSLARLANARIEARSNYPGWEYNEQSQLREVFTHEYKKMYDKEPKLSAIHAGVECGIFAGKIKDLDIIAFGPNIFDAHNPDERMSISSVKRTWEFLNKILTSL